jgi:hypothetical protein
MRRIVGKMVAAALPAVIPLLGRLPGRFKFLRAWAAEIPEHRAEAETLSNEVTRLIDEQVAANPLDPARKTVFLVLTSGQAVRNFLCSDVLPLLRARYNLVLIANFAGSIRAQAYTCCPGSRTSAPPSRSSFSTT